MRYPELANSSPSPEVNVNSKPLEKMRGQRTSFAALATLKKLH